MAIKLCAKCVVKLNETQWQDISWRPTAYMIKSRRRLFWSRLLAFVYLHLLNVEYSKSCVTIPSTRRVWGKGQWKLFEHTLAAIKCHLASRISHKIQFGHGGMHFKHVDFRRTRNFPDSVWLQNAPLHQRLVRCSVRVGRVCAVWLFRVVLRSMSCSWGRNGLFKSAWIYCYCFWFYADTEQF